MNFICGGFFACASGYTFANFFVASTAAWVLPLTRKPRQKKHIAVGLRADNKVAFRHFARVAGRQQQEFSALTLVGSGVADVPDVVEPEIINDAEHIRRRLDHQRAILQIEPHQIVDSSQCSG